jgi:hypothetical protein
MTNGGSPSGEGIATGVPFGFELLHEVNHINDNPKIKPRIAAIARP